MKFIVLMFLPVIAALQAQAPPAPPPTDQVLAILTLRPDVSRERLAKILPEEVRETVRLYLDGHIRQWWARGDGKGVVFLLDAKQVSDARAWLETLPLAKEKLADFDYMALGPLSPLRVLIDPPPPAK